MNLRILRIIFKTLLLRIIKALCLLPSLCIGQNFSGKVTDHRNQPLQGASISWADSKKSVLSNEEGSFFIPFDPDKDRMLIVSFTGFVSDSILIKDAGPVVIRLVPSKTLGEVKVTSKKKGIYISDDVIKTEVITSGELKKSACCDLAGCFETQGSVQPQTTNIITNAKELRILGLSGIYNQVLIDGFPMIQGLSYTYGISSIPGPLIDNIFVAKGANSVLQGYESISGQINVITKDPAKADKLFLNAYINSFAEKQFNAAYSIKKKSWSNLTAFHMVQPADRIDRDDDQFMDIPLVTRYMIMNRWKKGEEKDAGWSTQLNVRYLSERRVGGQMQFDYDEDKGGNLHYGQAVSISQPEGWFRTTYRFNERNRLVFFASSFHQDQQSYFGVTTYKADQTNAYANIQHEFSYGEEHVLKTGISYRYSRLNEAIRFSGNTLNRTYAGDYLTKEDIPGVFAENTLHVFDDRITCITGIRADYYAPEGGRVTPRAMIKWDASPDLIIRASAGTGWRIARIFSENTGLLASSRDVVFAEKLNPEEALNMGCNAVYKLSGDRVYGNVSLDLYHTVFRNQIFPDYDTDPNLAIIRNYTGRSVSNGFQFEGQVTFIDKLSLKASYVYLDVYQERGGEKVQLPFNPNHRLVGTASFSPKNKKWRWDANAHWYGQQRLPDTRSNPIPYRRPDLSAAFTVVSTQFTLNLRDMEIYAGVENIFDFRQIQPIIGWQDPFGKFFDTQFAWGPTRGIEMYLGLRFTVK